MDKATAQLLLDTAVSIGKIQDFRNGVAVLPAGYQLKPVAEVLDQFGEAPRHKEAAVTLLSADSFVEYWKRYVTPASVIFANPHVNDLKVVAVFDYHHPGSDAPSGWRKHHATLRLQPTFAWAAWYGKNGEQMNQEAFAHFIEDNVSDIAVTGHGYPSGAEMLEMAERIQVENKVSFVSGKKLSNGKIEFKYQEDMQAVAGGGQFSVPEKFALRLIPYQGSDVAEIEARLRFRINNEKKLVFWYSIVRPNTVVETAFNSAVQRIAAGTATTPFIGNA